MTTAGVIFQTAGSPHELEQPRHICQAGRESLAGQSRAEAVAEIR
jgi:hypothetical protein